MNELIKKTGDIFHKEKYVNLRRVSDSNIK